MSAGKNELNFREAANRALVDINNQMAASKNRQIQPHKISSPVKKTLGTSNSTNHFYLKLDSNANQSPVKQGEINESNNHLIYF
jgi:hypothetical protein